MTIAIRITHALTASVVALVGCNSLLGVQDLTQGETDAAVDIDAPPGTVSLRFVNVVRDFPGGGSIDVYVGEETTARVTALRNVSEYVVVDPSVTRISIRQQGQSGGAPLHEFTGLTLTGDTRVTAIIAGINASQAPDDRVRLLPLVEEFAQAGTGQAQVRFVHAITDVVAVGIDVGLNNDAAPEVTELARYGATPAAGMQATAGQTLRLGLVESGATYAAFAANGLELGKGCFVIFSGQRGAAFNSSAAMTSMTVCTSQSPVIGSLGSRVAIGHVVADGSTCAVTRLDGTVVFPSLDLRQFGTTWLMVEEEDGGGRNLNCGGQTMYLDLPSDIAGESARQIMLAGGTLSPSSTQQARLVEVPIPSTGSRHAYLAELVADVDGVNVRIDAADVALGVSGGQVIGPEFGQSASILSPGAHILSIEIIDEAMTLSFTVSGGTGGATLFVLEGARVPQGAQRALRLTPFDLSAFPPTAGTPIVPN